MRPAELLEEAEVLVRLAGVVLNDTFRDVRTIDFKGPGRGNLVTDADRAAERVIVEALRNRFPDHGLLTEESGAVSVGALRWILDPLDAPRTTRMAFHTSASHSRSRACGTVSAACWPRRPSTQSRRTLLSRARAGCDVEWATPSGERRDGARPLVALHGVSVRRAAEPGGSVGALRSSGSPGPGHATNGERCPRAHLGRGGALRRPLRVWPQAVGRHSGCVVDRGGAWLHCLPRRDTLGLALR